MTVDVEDYFQVSAFEHRLRRADWDKMESRVVASTDRILSLLDGVSVRGTFFILGWVAERYPELVCRIAAAGHEIASHGYWHRLVYDLKPDQFAQDLADSKDAIASACGIVPTAYRAPSFSIVEKSLWALDVLVEQGFTVDSSVFPIRGHDRYGIPSAKKEIHRIETKAGGLTEFPPSLAKMAGAAVPIGGGYFRLFPLRVTSRAIESVRRQSRPAMFYTHPWEIDPGQPRVSGIGRAARFRHYVGLSKTEDRLRRMLTRYPFAPMCEVLKRVNQTTESSETIAANRTDSEQVAELTDISAT
jgi:polysaccharide deacetylase family protein (PEP-CTERM system associated)